MKCERYWKYIDLPDSAFVEEAKKYATRDDWKRKAGGHYNHVRRHRRHLLPACTAHTVSPGSPFKEGYQVYAYEFSDHSVYVGITCNPARRHRDHLKKGPVADNTKAGLTYTLKIIRGGLKPTFAGHIEDDTIQTYWDAGWMVINRRNGGSTGQIRTKYSYAKLLEIARPAKTRKQFQIIHNGAYQHACTHGLMDRLASELGWPTHVGHVWTEDKCLQEAKRFNRLSDWANGHGASYQAAWKRDWHTQIAGALFSGV